MKIVDVPIRLIPITAVLLLPGVFIPIIFAPNDSRNILIGISSYLIGLIIASIIILLGQFKFLSVKKALLGGFLGIGAAFFVVPIIRVLANYEIGIGDSVVGHSIVLSTVYFLFFIIGVIGAQFESEEQFKTEKEKILIAGSEKKICDTSVLIDGRIAEMAEAGFLEGELVIPQFILKELQSIADSVEQLKRNRGRRGLDIVKQLQDNENLKVTITTEDYLDEKEVDQKLLRMAIDKNAALFTNDFNLNKVAKVRSVKVLNLNDLVNALKTIYLPGEEIITTITKEGKEQGQGIGYLDDGTMVVMDGAGQFTGKQVKAVVTNIHQTTAGRMIFSKFDSLVKQ